MRDVVKYFFMCSFLFSTTVPVLGMDDTQNPKHGTKRQREEDENEARQAKRPCASLASSPIKEVRDAIEILFDPRPYQSLSYEQAYKIFLDVSPSLSAKDLDVANFCRASMVARGMIFPAESLSYDDADDLLVASKLNLGGSEKFLADFYRNVMQALDRGWFLGDKDEDVYAFLMNSYDRLNSTDKALAEIGRAYMRLDGRILENTLSVDTAYDLFDSAGPKLPLLYRALSDLCRAKMRAQGLVSDEKLTALQAHNLFLSVQPYLFHEEDVCLPYILRAQMRLDKLISDEVMTEGEARLLLKEWKSEEFFE